MDNRLDDIKKLLLSKDIGIITMGFILLRSSNIPKEEITKDWNLWKKITSKKLMYLCYKYRPDLLTNFKTIYLEGDCIDIEQIFNYTNITHLTIKGNHIPVIDSRFAVFTKLRSLNIIECGVEDVTYNFSKNPDIVQMDLSVNLIKNLPDDFLKNGKLVNLNLKSNKFEKLPNCLDYHKNNFKCDFIAIHRNPFKYDNPLYIISVQLFHPKNYLSDYLKYEGQYPYLKIL